jgi:hypothetical protein
MQAANLRGAHAAIALISAIPLVAEIKTPDFPLP